MSSDCLVNTGRTERDTNDEQASIEGLLSDDVLPDLSGRRGEPVDSCEASNQEEDGEQQQGVCEDSINAETSDDDGVVSTKVPCLILM